MNNRSADSSDKRQLMRRRQQEVVQRNQLRQKNIRSLINQIETQVQMLIAKPSQDLLLKVKDKVIECLQLNKKQALPYAFLAKVFIVFKDRSLANKYLQYAIYYDPNLPLIQELKNSIQQLPVKAQSEIKKSFDIGLLDFNEKPPQPTKPDRTGPLRLESKRLNNTRKSVGQKPQKEAKGQKTFKTVELFDFKSALEQPESRKSMKPSEVKFNKSKSGFNQFSG